MSCCCDDELCEVWLTSWPRARKPHQCVDCGKTIAAGARYRLTKSFYEGWETNRSCERCGLRREEWARLHRGREPAMGCLYDMTCVIECEPWVWYDAHRAIGGPIVEREYINQLGEMSQWGSSIGLLVRWRFDDYDTQERA